MASKDLFASKRTAPVYNAAGGVALDPGAEHSLAQMAITSTLADSCYTSAEEQLKTVLDLCERVRPLFVAQLAVYARQNGMKDLPAVLLMNLVGRKETSLVERTFPKVVDNGRMLRNFVQMLRSGVFGRRSLSSSLQRLVQNWFHKQGPNGVFTASVGSDPSMRDVLRLARPTPKNEEESQMFSYLVGKGPAVGKAAQLIGWRSGEAEIPQGVPFELLAGAASEPHHWEEMARSLSWNATLKNLNTFARHEISAGAWDVVAERLKGHVPRHVFPYNIFTAYRFTENTPGVPPRVLLAVQDALDASLANVPAFPRSVGVCVDISGSMRAPATGQRGSATGVTTCADVAALFASAIFKQNPEAWLFTFDTQARQERLNPRDSVITNAKALSRHGGGTDCSAPLRLMLSEKRCPDLVVIISDNESWWDRGGWGMARGHRTTMQKTWPELRKLNKGAKLVCIDVEANPTVQLQDSKDTLNLGGFSDSMFGLIRSFAAGELSAARWVELIKQTEV